MSNIQEYITQINAAIDSRVAYEQSKNCAQSMLDNLTSLRKSVTHESVAKHLLASSVDANYLNRQERQNARYNIYASDKVDNIARTLASVASLNHYSLAIIKVALALEAKSLTLTHKDAVSACSATVKHSDAKREALIKTLRYAKHVAANTASTQSSSSLNALCTFNILSETRDDANNVAYRVNRESEALKALCKRYEIAL